MPTPSGLVTKQELINAQLDTAHLGRVVNSKDASGAPISTSTNRTGGVNKTLDALQAEYTSAIQSAGGVALNDGVWAVGQTFTTYNQYMVYNSVPYKPKSTTTLPYGPTGATPDFNFVQPYVQISADDVLNPNLISNANFEVSGSVANPPDATPRAYNADDELFQGVKAVGALTGVTYVNGILGGTGQLYIDVVKTTKMQQSTAGVVASVAGADGKPITTGVTVVDNTTSYRVTFDIAGVFSVKLEQGSVATRHSAVEEVTLDYIGGVAALHASCVADMLKGLTSGGVAVTVKQGQTWMVEDYYGMGSPSYSGSMIFKVVVDGTSVADGGKCIQGIGVQFIQNLKTPYSVKAWGAKGGDNVADTQAFLKSAEYITSIGGGTLLAPACNTGEYLVDEDILLGDNTTVITDAWVKRNSLGTRKYDTMLVPIPGAQNVRIEKAMLDCNNLPSISGVNFRRNNRGCTGGVIRVKNAKISPTLGGGRAVIAEEGVTGREPKLNAIDTIIAENCFNAFIFNGGAGTSEGDKSNAATVIGKIICTDVQCPVAFTGNNPTYPHNGAEMSCIVKTLMGTNCGVVTDPQPSSAVFGIVGGIRASNCEISSGYIYNDPSYSSSQQIYAYRGEYKNVKISLTIDSELDNIVFDGNSPISFSGDVTTISGSSLATVADSRDFEVGYGVSSVALPAGTKIVRVDSLNQVTLSNSAISTGTNQTTVSGVSVCRDSEFNITVNRTVNGDLFTSSISDSGHLLNNVYNFSVNQTNDNMVPNNINNQEGNYLFLRSKPHKCFVFGRVGAGEISAGFKISTFAGYMGQLGKIVMSDLNGNAHTLSAGTSQLLFDGSPV